MPKINKRSKYTEAYTSALLFSGISNGKIAKYVGLSGAAVTKWSKGNPAKDVNYAKLKQLAENHGIKTFEHTQKIIKKFSN